MLCSNCVLHYDRYKYLCLKTAYKSNSQEALEKIISFKIITFFVTFLGFALDPEVRNCQNRAMVISEILIITIKENDIFWRLIPSMISLGFNLNVLRYAIKVKMREDSSHEQQNTNEVHGENNAGLEMQSISQRVSHNEMYPNDIISKKKYSLYYV